MRAVPLSLFSVLSARRCRRDLAKLVAGLCIAVLGACALTGVSRAQVRHVKPSALAMSAARDLPWHTSLESAFEAAKAKKRPLFWYVPTVPRSPMDRQNIVDLYMRAGFFCEPDLRAMLANFELYGKAPTKAEAARFDLKAFRFIEPGFLILDAEGTVKARAHAISTFSPKWFATQLLPFLPEDQEKVSPRSAAAARDARLIWKTGYAVGVLKSWDYGRENGQALPKLDAEHACQLALVHMHVGQSAKAFAMLEAAEPTDRVCFLRAALHAYSGKPARARAEWKKLARETESKLWGPRAAAEAEGFGPISRGFWVFGELMPEARTLTSTTAPRKEADFDVLIERNVELLFALQGENGGFEDSNYDFGGLDSLPNVYVAGTALACQALWRYRHRDPKRHDRAVRVGLDYCVDPKSRNDKDLDEWIWARVYTLELLSTLLQSSKEDGAELQGWPQERLLRASVAIAHDIFSRQRKDGSFRHEYANPFVTATVLHGLWVAKGFGVKLPEPEIARALASLERCKTKLGAYSYGQTRAGRSARATVPAAVGRMPLCESALYVFGRASDEDLRMALAKSFEHHDGLERSRKYDDHAGPLGIGGFFFWYDMRARARAMMVYGGDAKAFKAKQRALLLAIPEIDGTWIDSHELGRSYGAAMGLLCARML